MLFHIPQDKPALCDPLELVRYRADHRVHDLILLTLCLPHGSRPHERAPEPLIAHALFALHGTDADAERRRIGALLSGCTESRAVDPAPHAVQGVRHPDIVSICSCHAAARPAELKGTPWTADNHSVCCPEHLEEGPGSRRYLRHCWADEALRAQLVRGEEAGLRASWVAPASTAPSGWELLLPTCFMDPSPTTDIALLHARARSAVWGLPVAFDDGRPLLGVTVEEVTELRVRLDVFLADERARRSRGGKFGQLTAAADALGAQVRDDRANDYWESATILRGAATIGVNWQRGGLRAYRVSVDDLPPGSAAARHWEPQCRRLPLMSGGTARLYTLDSADLTGAVSALLEVAA
jgi:hypothetical protein